ncbi:hypothetical protein ACT29H_16620, partial [Thermophagus sp. OGC60D27]|uniref:hypothetical protein n=1 Tax=Thermophagus sp. OGC60D27 TaxID=3458415 RepID=UPI004037E6FF
ILGFIPLAGEALDVVNGMWYLVEGDGGNATLCFASMLPVVGDAAVKSSKYAIKIIKGRKLQKLFDLTDESLAAYGRIAKTLQKGGEITCRECLELSGKLLAHNPGKAAAIEKLAMRITDSDQLKAVLNTVDEMGITQKGKFLDDVRQIDDVAKFDAGLVEAWKKMDNLGADDALRQNTGALKALEKKTAGDEVPLPDTYLDANYINSHLSKFDNGGSYLVPKSVLDNRGRDLLGRPDGQFIIPKSEMDDLLTKTGGDITKIEKELGIPEGLWEGQELSRIDIPDLSDLNKRMSSGNEIGANELWMPGGKTPAGYSEVVVDQIPKGKYIENPIK